MQNSLGMAAGSLNFRLLSAGLLSAVGASILCLQGLSNGHLEVKHLIVSVVFAAVYTGVMLSEKYVKQEHNFWYPVSLIWFGYLGYFKYGDCSPFSRALPVLVQFLGLSWTQSGDATDMLPEIFQTFLSRYPLILWIMLSYAYISTAVRLDESVGSAGGLTIISKILATTLGVLPLLLKFGSAALNTPDLVTFTSPWVLSWLAQVNLNSIAKVIFSLLAATLVYLLAQKGNYNRTKGRGCCGHFVFSCSFRTDLAGIHHILALYLMTQSRPRNIPLFLIFQWQLEWLSRYHLSSPTIHSLIFLRSFSALNLSCLGNCIVHYHHVSKLLLCLWW